jgi:hypothetical protein
MRRIFVIFLSILVFLSALVLGSAILSNNSSAKPPPNAPGLSGATEIHWASVRTTQGPPFIVYASHPSISVREQQWGVYMVTFPNNFKVLACTATLNHSMGTVVAVPGHACCEDNEVSVMVFSTNWNFTAMDFAVVAYSKRGANK